MKLDIFNTRMSLLSTAKRIVCSFARFSLLGLWMLLSSPLIAETIVDQRFADTITNVVKWTNGMHFSMMTDTELETPSGKGAVMVRVDDVQGGEQETSSERVAQLWIQYSGELIPEGNYRLSLLWKASPEMPVTLDVITVEKPYEMGIKSRNTEIPSEWTTEVWEFNVKQGFSENKIRLPLLSFGNAPEGATFWIAELKVETVDAAATSTKPTLK